MSKISKKQVKEKIDELESIDEFEESKLANKKVKIIFVGTKKDNMKKSTFENKVLEFMSNVNDFIKEQKEFNVEQKEFNKKIESRLDVLEKDMKEVKKDIKDMKSTSTMNRELSSLKKNKALNF